MEQIADSTYTARCWFHSKKTNTKHRYHYIQCFSFIFISLKTLNVSELCFIPKSYLPQARSNVLRQFYVGFFKVFYSFYLVSSHNCHKFGSNVVAGGQSVQDRLLFHNGQDQAAIPGKEVVKYNLLVK